MKNRLIIFIVAFSGMLFFVAGYLQASAPGAEWYYSTKFMTPDMGYYQLKYLKDTTVNEKICKVFEGIDYSSDRVILSRDSYYVLYEEKRVYEYIDPAFHLLYDFDVHEGDTIKTTYSFTKNRSGILYMNLKVSNVKDTLIDDLQLRSYSFDVVDSQNEYCIGFSGVALEYIGNISGFLFPRDCMPTDMQRLEFRCYQDDNFLFKSESYKDKACDSVYRFNPNRLPENTYDDLEIVFGDDYRNFMLTGIYADRLKFDILDCRGIVCMKGKLICNTPVSITSLPSGIYLLFVYTDSKRRTMKFLKN